MKLVEFYLNLIVVNRKLKRTISKLGIKIIEIR